MDEKVNNATAIKHLHLEMVGSRPNERQLFSGTVAEPLLRVSN